MDESEAQGINSDKDTQVNLGEQVKSWGEKERERYLEMSHSMGRAPVFMIGLAFEGEKMTEDDLLRAVDIANKIGGDRQAVIEIHRGPNSVDVSGAFATNASYERYLQVLDDLAEEDIEAVTAMGVPEVGDGQYVTVVPVEDRRGDENIKRNAFTVFGSGVLGMARGPKARVEKSMIPPIYRISRKGSHVGAKGTMYEAVSSSSLEWPSAINLPGGVLWERKSGVKKKVYKAGTYDCYKPDMNDAGKKIVDQDVQTGSKDDLRMASENRRLVVAANFNLLARTGELVQMRAGDLQGDPDVSIDSRLGESFHIIIPRGERVSKTTGRKVSLVDTYKSIIRDFTEKPAPDIFLLENGDILKPRTEALGHLSNIALPIEEGDLTVYEVGGTSIMDAAWDPQVERALETFHKTVVRVDESGKKQVGKRPSEIVSEKDLEEI